ncbi:MAG: twin-arginine translocation signal domain-containing protein, partial [Thermodesulfobacteriota bacterium]
MWRFYKLETTRRIFLKTLAAGTVGSALLNIDPFSAYAETK